MKRTLLVLGMVLALAMTAMASVEPDYADGIASPMAGEVVYENTLFLEARNSDTAASLLDANDPDRTIPFIGWAIRSPVVGDCEGDVNNVVGDTNSDVFAGTKAFDTATGTFTAEIDITTWPAGEYCFVFVPTDQLQARQHLSFYIVDEYAKVGGNVDNADYLLNFDPPLDLKELRGNQLSHALEGVVGNAGSAGTVGSITVNYRQLDEYLTFDADDLNLSAAGGIGVTDPTARAAVMAVGGSEILLLDKDASPNFERGAAIVRFNGGATVNKYEVDATPGSTGADSWVPLVNGNVEVGRR